MRRLRPCCVRFRKEVYFLQDDVCTARIVDRWIALYTEYRIRTFHYIPRFTTSFTVEYIWNALWPPCEAVLNYRAQTGSSTRRSEQMKMQSARFRRRARGRASGRTYGT